MTRNRPNLRWHSINATAGEKGLSLAPIWLLGAALPADRHNLILWWLKSDLSQRQTMPWLTKNVNSERGKLQIGPGVSWRIINVTFPWHLVGGIVEEPEEGEEGSRDMSQWGKRETGRTTGQKEHKQGFFLTEHLDKYFSYYFLCCSVRTKYGNQAAVHTHRENTNRPTLMFTPSVMIKLYFCCLVTICFVLSATIHHLFMGCYTYISISDPR